MKGAFNERRYRSKRYNSCRYRTLLTKDDIVAKIIPEEPQERVGWFGNQSSVTGSNPVCPRGPISSWGASRVTVAQLARVSSLI